MAELTYYDLGRCRYGRGCELQDTLAERVIASPAELAYMLLLEHDPPVITMGRSAKGEHVVTTPAALAAAGVEVARSPRGGDVTYHAPGQLIAYPIVRLDLHGRDVRGYLRALEEAVILTLADFGLTGRRDDRGRTGVWVGHDKVAAIGVAIRKRWVASHGLALNVDVDLAGFNHIVPCGIRDCGVTSMSTLLGSHVGVEQVKAPLVRHLADVLAFERAVEGRL